MAKWESNGGGGNSAATYKVYTALLTQTGTNAPVATVKENTLGVTISYAYSGDGIYEVNSSASIFDSGTVFFTQLNETGVINVLPQSATQVLIATFDMTGASANLMASNPASFRIEVYP